MATDLSERLCPQCQQPIVQGATTCPNCGLVFSGEPDPAEAASPAPADTLPVLSDTVDGSLPTIAALEEASPTAPALEASASQPPSDAEAPLSGALDSLPLVDDLSSPPTPPTAPTSQWGSRRLKLALIGVAILLVLSATGAGITYVLTRPQPRISVTSAYQVGKVPAGSATTTLQVEGRQFAANSGITFLLDGQPAPGSQIVPSDEHGNFEADLAITARWKVGAHRLTARDMNGNVTESSVTVQIVRPGAAHTPGLNGAPADDTPRFMLYLTTVSKIDGSNGIGVLPVYGGNGVGSPVLLTVQGRPDPAGGSVCDPQNDDGQPHTINYTFTEKITLPDGSTVNVSNFFSNGLQQQTTEYTCSGTYQGGKISYTETNSIYQETYTNGVTCGLTAPRIVYQLQGAFVSPGIASGVYTVPASSVPCSNGSSEQTGADAGTWTGILISA